jgi:magnesium transporter
MTETARDLLASPVPTAHPSDTAGATLSSLRGGAFACGELACVLDEAGRLVGVVPLGALLAAPAEATVASLARADVAAVAPDTDQEHVAATARANGVATVPVVDGDGRLLGVVPAIAIVDVLRREHVEDLHRLAGISDSDGNARRAIEDSPLRRARRRLPWLLVGLGGSVLATGVVARFEPALERSVALAFFMPAIVYLADAIGTQTEAAAVRGLSLVHRPLGRLLAGELATGLIIGLVLALFALPLAWLGFGDLRLAIAVALAIVVAGSVAAGVGLLFPWLLSRFGFDPAYGSGPVATIIQDVLSLLAYFGIALGLIGM